MYHIKYDNRVLEVILLLIDILKDTTIDSLEILPFLFIAFCILETFSHRSEHLNADVLSHSKYAGPFLGALLGCIPQCGIPVLAINLYAGALVSPGTLMAVLISTSDEAVLVLLNDPAGQKIIFPLLMIKVIVATIFGYIVDLCFGKSFISPEKISHHEGHAFCHSHGIILSALSHTISLFFYLFVFSFAINILLHTVGLKSIATILLDGSVLQPLLSALIGLIPNCAAALSLCELYLDGILNFPSLVAGLCTSAGVGLLVLIKTHTNKKELLKIMGSLYITGIITGLLLHFIIC